MAGYFVCRDCGAESKHWHAENRCIHCGASARSRITPERVNRELSALGSLYGEREKSDPIRDIRERIERESNPADRQQIFNWNTD